MAKNQGKHEVGNILTEWPSHMSVYLFDLVKRCLDYTPWERPDAAKLRDAAKLFLEKGIWDPKEKIKEPEPIVRPMNEPINPPLRGQGPFKLRAWIIILVALILLALLAMCSISSAKYKGLVKEGDALLSNRDTAAALVKYKEAVGINLYATTELKGKIDSLEHPVRPIIGKEKIIGDRKPEEVTKTNTKNEGSTIKSKDGLVDEVEKTPTQGPTTTNGSGSISIPPLPNVSFKASEDQIYTGQSVVFTDNTDLPSGFRLRNYEWDFGDGAKSRGTTPREIQHSYSTPGVYEVKLCYNNGSVCSKSFSIRVETEPKPHDKEASIGLKLSEKVKCADPVFEEGVFSLTLQTKVSVDLTSLTVFANTGSSVTISLVEGGEVLSTIRRRVAQSTAGSSLPLTQVPDLDAGKTYTLQLRTEGAKLQNIATCSPDLENNNTRQLSMEYNASRYVIFDLKYNY
jgi:hypothetical protein